MKGLFKFYDRNNNLIDSVSAIKLQFKRSLIIEKSIEEYDESDPCIIYSTYCTQILGNDLLDEIKKKYPSVENLEFVEKIPDFIKDKLEIADDVYKIRIE